MKVHQSKHSSDHPSTNSQEQIEECAPPPFHPRTKTAIDLPPQTESACTPLLPLKHMDCAIIPYTQKKEAAVRNHYPSNKIILYSHYRDYSSITLPSAY